MEEIIKKMVKYVLEKSGKYSFIVDVLVSRERDVRLNYIDKQKNYRYMVFLVMDPEVYDPELVTDDDKWNEIRELIRDTIKTMGITNHINIYWDI